MTEGSGLLDLAIVDRVDRRLQLREQVADRSTLREGRIDALVRFRCVQGGLTGSATTGCCTTDGTDSRRRDNAARRWLRFLRVRQACISNCAVSETRRPQGVTMQVVAQVDTAGTRPWRQLLASTGERGTDARGRCCLPHIRRQRPRHAGVPMVCPVASQSLEAWAPACRAWPGGWSSAMARDYR